MTMEPSFASTKLPDEPAEGSAVTKQAKVFKIPYTPRRHFRPLHESKKRFKFVVAHRRAGKSVAAINEIIKRALQNPRQHPPPRYGYVGPSFAQTKDLIWGYLKHFTSVFGDMVKTSEGDLQVTLPNGAMINLYGGASAYERMRGLYFDGIVLDEFSMLNPSVLSTVVRPCLADYRGWCIVSGTSNGDDHFHELKKRAEKETEQWEIFIIPVNETDALHPDEVVEMTKDMSAEEYAREMLCSFDAPVEGSYYGSIINDLQLATPARVCKVPYDPAVPVYTWWDLGIDDATAIWFFQAIGPERRLIRYKEYTGMKLADIVADIKSFTHVGVPYNYGLHIFPHDAKARELGTGVSREEILRQLLNDVYVAKLHRVEDGIEASKALLPQCWFDEELCAAGLSSLKNYHKTKSGRPDHNWASHGADAFRVGAMNINMIGAVGGNVIPLNGPLRRRIRGAR